MKKQLNDGQGDYAIQNQFTAYLQTSLHRTRTKYIIKKSKYLSYELLFDHIDGSEQFKIELDFTVEPDIKQQLDCNLLINATRRLNQKELKIFYLKALDGLSFVEIADVTGLKYGTAKDTTIAQ